jgi:hypothetical protein
MKVVLALGFLFALASAEVNVDIDWSNVRPIEHYPKFWDDKPAHLRPSVAFFNAAETKRSGRIVGGNIAT